MVLGIDGLAGDVLLCGGLQLFAFPLLPIGPQQHASAVADVPQFADGSHGGGSLPTWGAAVGGAGSPVLLSAAVVRRAGELHVAAVAAMDAVFSHPGVPRIGGGYSWPLYKLPPVGVVFVWTPIEIGAVPSVTSALVALRRRQWLVPPRQCCALRLRLWFSLRGVRACSVKLSRCGLGSRMPFDFAGSTLLSFQGLGVYGLSCT